jgi:CMP-N,N'-diacetyllegionaminic acid synthase
MGQVIALIPARSGSKGIPGKNWRPLAGGLSCVELAIDCAQSVGVQRVCVSTDAGVSAYTFRGAHGCDIQHIDRPPELAQDDTPMIAVVKHALEQIPGQPDDIIVLLQPTQPFRTPARVREAIQLLQSTGADSVVSVVPLPLTHHMLCQFMLRGGRIPHLVVGFGRQRQQLEQSYIRDGTVYAFRRATVERHGTIYGQDVRPLILEPHETCEMDTEADWHAVEARWNARTSVSG